MPKHFLTLCFLVCFPVLALGLQSEGDSLPELITRLKDEDPAIREKAVLALTELGPMANMAVPGLIETLADPKAHIAELARSALFKIGAAAVPDLVKTLKKGKDEKTREGAIQVLATLRNASGDAKKVLLDVLFESLTDQNDKVKEYAIWNVTAPPPCIQALPKLVEFLKDRKSAPNVQFAAMLSIGRYGAEAEALLPLVLEAWQKPGIFDRDARRAAGISLAKIGPKNPEVLNALKNTLNNRSEDFDLRTMAVTGLSIMRAAAKPALPDLVAVLTKEECSEAASILHANALTALPQIDPESDLSFQTIMQIMQVRADVLDPKWKIRGIAIEQIPNFPRFAGKAVPKLIDILRTKDCEREPLARVLAVLGNIGPPARAAIPVLEEFVESSDRDLRLLQPLVQATLRQIRGEQ